METRVLCSKCKNAMVAECQPNLVKLVCPNCGYMEVICKKG